MAFNSGFVDPVRLQVIQEWAMTRVVNLPDDWVGRASERARGGVGRGRPAGREGGSVGRKRLITGDPRIWDLEILRWIWGRSLCCFDQSFLGG